MKIKTTTTSTTNTRRRGGRQLNISRRNLKIALKKADYAPSSLDLEDLVAVLERAVWEPETLARWASTNFGGWLIVPPWGKAGFFLGEKDGIPLIGVHLADGHGGWSYYSDPSSSEWCWNCHSEYVLTYCRFVYRQVAPLLAAPEEGTYANKCGVLARRFGLPFEVVHAFGPDPWACAEWRKVREAVPGLITHEVYDLVAGIDRRKSAIARIVDRSHACDPVHDDEWHSRLEGMGQSRSQTLANDLLEVWKRGLLNHGINVVPSWATLAVKPR